MEFLCQHLFSGLQWNVIPFDGFFREARRGNEGCCKEIDFTFLEQELHVMPGILNLLREIPYDWIACGVEGTQVLGVLEKNVDVVGNPVIQADCQRGSAAP